ncbi:hypothetical protein PN36_29145 [Candidatus Thiomargarita nelsonii]|uniref:Uncharacterized protein n=1 Tax=Candidatus Thiomargarita nelsonii TaxID=1003181 RepID=A0A4E0RE26_9GAMM|nr:hypothetical protein PN36_29145 [Candidatus Thiomargarita nelsonii]
MPQIVRANARQAICEIEYSREKDEAYAINDVFSALEKEPPFQSEEAPISMPALVVWKYPKKGEFYGKRNFMVESANSLTEILGARGQIAQAVSMKLIPSSLFQRVGGVCYLDQLAEQKLLPRKLNSGTPKSFIRTLRKITF